jgi:hypothetical protein
MHQSGIGRLQYYQRRVPTPIEEIYEDEWLDGLRSTGEFQEFLGRLEKRQKSRP